MDVLLTEWESRGLPPTIDEIDELESVHVVDSSYVVDTIDSSVMESWVAKWCGVIEVECTDTAMRVILVCTRTVLHQGILCKYMDNKILVRIPWSEIGLRVFVNLTLHGGIFITRIVKIGVLQKCIKILADDDSVLDTIHQLCAKLVEAACVDTQVRKTIGRTLKYGTVSLKRAMDASLLDYVRVYLALVFALTADIGPSEDVSSVCELVLPLVLTDKAELAIAVLSNLPLESYREHIDDLWPVLVEVVEGSELSTLVAAPLVCMARIAPIIKDSVDFFNDLDDEYEPFTKTPEYLRQHPTLVNRMILSLTEGGVVVSALVGEVLWGLCGDADVFIKRVGVGNAAGVLANKGMFQGLV